MCVHPIRLVNPSYATHGGQHILSVPCGKCDECRRQKQDDYYLRCLANYYKYNEQSGWSVHFFTLTFNEENLPKGTFYAEFSDIPEDDPNHYLCLGDPMPCFNHDLIKTFSKSLAQYYRRRHLPTPHLLITSEYGELRHRPHYHGAAFVPEILNFKQFQQTLLRFWHYGFVQNNRIYFKNQEHVERNLTNAFRYVCKYACKGNSWLPEYMRHIYKDGVLVTHICKEFKEHQYKPRLFTTNGFGDTLLDLLTEDNYITGKVTLPQPENKKQPYKTFSIPSYYMRRHFTESQSLTKLESDFITKHFPWLNEPIVVEQKHTKTECTYLPSYYELRAHAFVHSIADRYDKMMTVYLSDTSSDLLISFHDYIHEHLPKVQVSSKEVATAAYLLTYHPTELDNIETSPHYVNINPRSPHIMRALLCLNEYLQWDIERRSLQIQVQNEKSEAYIKQNNILPNCST